VGNDQGSAGGLLLEKLPFKVIFDGTAGNRRIAARHGRSVQRQLRPKCCLLPDEPTDADDNSQQVGLLMTLTPLPK
jgi:hypothetical protein